MQHTLTRRATGARFLLGRLQPPAAPDDPYAADRGGPVGRAIRSARASLGAALPGTAAPCRPAESSPIGGMPAHGLAAMGLITALALGGALCAADGAWIYVKAAAGQWLLERAWTRSAVDGTAAKPWPWADTHPIARLIVPAHGIDEIVLAGASGRTLAWGPGHYDGSALPGAEGNAVLSAHRDTHFRFLQRLVPGDGLEIETREGMRRHYRVRDVAVVDTHALRIPRDTAVATLTLVTCYPFDAVVPGGPLRYVVVAEADGGSRPPPVLAMLASVAANGGGHPGPGEAIE